MTSTLLQRHCPAQCRSSPEPGVCFSPARHPPTPHTEEHFLYTQCHTPNDRPLFQVSPSLGAWELGQLQHSRAHHPHGPAQADSPESPQVNPVPLKQGGWTPPANPVLCSHGRQCKPAPGRAKKGSLFSSSGVRPHTPHPHPPHKMKSQPGRVGISLLITLHHAHVTLAQKPALHTSSSRSRGTGHIPQVTIQRRIARPPCLETPPVPVPLRQELGSMFGQSVLREGKLWVWLEH